ncbi:uncharacterized protein LOC103718678 [Phoenix dactylifera]|uniref:Uncharacterized protein LOC103718678 n=1 Tax=Phoenix dactylifera TaxID=42345 RepID=A0A8B8ZM64_PHODC|nr:uncharacterized protein LOC103718678 [Phoenix dactylifera]
MPPPPTPPLHEPPLAATAHPPPASVAARPLSGANGLAGGEVFSAAADGGPAPSRGPLQQPDPPPGFSFEEIRLYGFDHRNLESPLNDEIKISGVPSSIISGNVGTWRSVLLGEEGRVGRQDVEGIVVVFAWLSSEARDLKPYIDIYWSLGWSCLVCHADFLTLFFSDKARSLACGVLDELVKELEYRPLPIVLATFSGGSKGCMYMVLQLLEGECGGQVSLDDISL